MADSTVKKTLKVKKAQAHPMPATDTDDADAEVGEEGEAVTMPAEQVRVVPAAAKKPPYTYAAILALLATLSVVVLMILQYVEWDTYDPMFPRAVQIAAPAAGR